MRELCGTRSPLNPVRRIPQSCTNALAGGSALVQTHSKLASQTGWQADIRWPSLLSPTAYSAKQTPPIPHLHYLLELSSSSPLAHYLFDFSLSFQNLTVMHVLMTLSNFISIISFMFLLLFQSQDLTTGQLSWQTWPKQHLFPPLLFHKLASH